MTTRPKKNGDEEPQDDAPSTRETTMADMSIQGEASSSLIRAHAVDESASSETHDYIMMERISDGGQATVFKAKTRDTGELVALKIFKSTQEDRLSEQRFQREAQILASLSHQNIVGYKGVFTAEGEWGESRKCLVMEFLEGVSLKDYIHQHPQGLPWEQAVSIFEQSLRALIFAHDDKGIVHRDIKPSNIIIQEDGTVKLIDFGIARLSSSGTHTGGSGLLGSFDYMAPDFARIKDAEFRGDEISDIFSLFVCFYEMIAARLPYPKLGERQEIDYLQRWHGEVDPPSTTPVIFRVITHLSKFVQKGLEADRAKRYQRYADVLADLSTLKPRVIVHEQRERYVLLDGLGAGGFSEVYKAKRESDGKVVAIKRLFANRSLDRFIKEAEMLSLHPHPNVVQYYDFFEMKSSGGRTDSFLVMEYLDGMPGWSLRERIREHPDGLPVAEVLETFAYYLSTLSYLFHHKHSVIHRDIKPANLYAPEGAPAQAKLLDFGGARDLSGTKTTGNLPGTWDFMAPEFVTEGSRGTHQSDLYAIGLSLYEALTGRTAYPRLPKGEKEALNEFLKRAKGLSDLKIDFKRPVFEKYPELQEIIEKSTARQPKSRYSDAIKMRQDLERVFEKHFGKKFEAVKEGKPEAPAKAAHGAATLNPFQEAHAQRRRESMVKAVKGIAAVIVLGVIAFGAWQKRSVVTGALSKMKEERAASAAQAAQEEAAKAAAVVPPVEPKVETKVATKGDEAPAEPVAMAGNEEKTTPVVSSPPVVTPPPPPVEPAVSRRDTLVRELVLALEPLTYFVAAGSKYDMIYADISKTVGTMNKTMSSPKYAEVGSDPAILDQQVAIWRGMLNEVLNIMREQKNVTLLPLARGCFYAMLDLRMKDGRGLSLQERYKDAIAEVEKDQPPGSPPALYPFPASDVLKFTTKDDGTWPTNPFLDDVFSRPEASDVRARYLPHGATLNLKAQSIDGRVLRKFTLPLVLVPDGSSGPVTSPDPFYIATIETTLEAMRCYRDDAARRDPAMRKYFSGTVLGKTIGMNDQPFFQARVDEAVEFCNWASALSGRPFVYRRNEAGRWVADLRQPGFRLPTTTEWEYAARYGFDVYPMKGAKPWDEMKRGLSSGNLVYYYFKKEPRMSTAAEAYPLGMFDMCGNVEEICMDSANALVATEFEPRFLLKGGSAKSRTDGEVMPAAEARTIDATHEFVGFRILMSSPFARF